MQVGIIAEQLRQKVPGGIGTYVTGLLSGLKQLDDPTFKTVVVASKGPDPDPVYGLGDYTECFRLGHRAMGALWDSGLMGPPPGLDLLHHTSLAGPRESKVSPKLTYMVHDLAWKAHPELTTRRGRRWHDRALRRALGSSAHLIAPSSGVAGDLVAEGVSPERISVIGEGSDHLPAPDGAATDHLLASLGIEGPFVLTVSTLEPRKNLGRLIEAHSTASRRTGSSWPLVVVGPSGWGRSIKATDGVHLAGPVGPAVLAGLYGTCAAFAYVPLLEGFGLPPLEAMAHGAPVVASTATPSMEGAPTVGAVEPTDLEAITAALCAAMETPLRQSIGIEAEHFASSHRWVDVGRDHRELWRSLL
jgi:glycosyltransferase involved in cell wall biosynthesis